MSTNMETKTSKRIFLSSPHMSDTHMEKYYIEDAFQKNFIAPLGENVDKFEQELSKKAGINGAAALSSGTAAIHLALKSLGVSNGDIVFCPTLTFSATANPIVYVGAEPVFIDSDQETWNINPAALKCALEKYKAMDRLPKAVMVVHLYGKAANLDVIMPLCKEYGIPVIEDAAESLGSLYTGEITGNKPRYTGTFGDFGIFSFNGNKIITTSGGGALICNDPDREKANKKIEKVRFWSTQSREPYRYYQHEEIGYNYRMSNITAGIGRGQLTVLDDRVAKKQEIYNYYKKELADVIPFVSMMPILPNESSNCWLSCITLDENSSVKPLDIILALEKENIESRHIWKPLHLQPVFRDCDFISVDEQGQILEREDFTIIDPETGADNSIAGKIFYTGVCLPSDTKSTEEDLQRVCRIIRDLYNI